MTGVTPVGAYRKGWDAYGRGTALDVAEGNFIARHGQEYWHQFEGGFLDRNAERPKYHDLDWCAVCGGIDPDCANCELIE